MQSGDGGHSPSLSDLPTETQLTGWGCNNQTKPLASLIPFHSRWLVSLYASFNDSTCTLSATGPFNSDSKELWQCRETPKDSAGVAAGRIKASGASESQEVSPLTSLLILPNVLTCPGHHLQPLIISFHSLSLSKSRLPNRNSLQTQNSQPTVPLPQDSYLTCLPGKTAEEVWKDILQIHKSGIPEGLGGGEDCSFITLHISEFLQRESAAFEIKVILMLAIWVEGIRMFFYSHSYS